MSKVLLGPQSMVYPMPALLIGVNIDDKPDFMAAAWGGIANGEPPMISVAIRHNRYTNLGIKQNLTFSVNIPSVDMVKEADYCGLASGARVDKVKACQFKVFYGQLHNAPLIEQCPVNLECSVKHILDLGSHSLVIGQIEETYISESCLTKGKADINKIKPLIYITRPIRHYHAMGEFIAKAHSVGRELKE